MDYRALLDRLYALAPRGVRLGLEPTAEALGRLGDPQAQGVAVHIAGSNGKGSTAALAESMLRAAGLRTGLYTSPHLVRFSERIRVNGEEITPETAARLGGRVLALPVPLTFFETVTVMAFLAFAEAGVDVAVIECGLGGRLDATTLCRPAVTAITSISLEHTALLGSTLEAIAGEKAGILKPGVPVVTGALAPEADAIIAACARACAAPIYRDEVDFAVERCGAGWQYRGPGGPLGGLELGLAGAHQRHNAAMALAMVALLPTRLGGRDFGFDAPACRRGLADVRWPGRLERLAPDLWIDAAHNPESARILAAAVRQVIGERVVLLLGVLADKDVAATIAPLVGHAGRIVVTRPPSPRALATAELARCVQTLAPSTPVAVADDPADALVLARTLATAEAPVLGCGSIYLIGALRRLVTGEPGEPVALSDPLPRA